MIAVLSELPPTMAFVPLKPQQDVLPEAAFGFSPLGA